MQQVGESLWIIDGPVVTSMGFRFPTRMTLIRLGDGGLIAWSPVALSDELKAQVDALGSVRHIVAPNALHHLSIAQWQAAYPGAETYAAPGLAERQKHLSITHELGDEVPAAWAADMDMVLVRGNRITTEAVLFHEPSRAVVFTDILQNYPRGWFTGLQAFIAWLDLMLQPQPTVPRKFRVAFFDRKTARESLRRILAWPAETVLMAHGTPVTEDAQAYLKKAFRWLRK